MAAAAADITAEEVRAHATRASCWIIIEGKVYDVSEFIAQDKHPGGVEPILKEAGKDCTDAFGRVGHSPRALKQLLDYEIGLLAAPEAPPNSLALPTSMTQMMTTLLEAGRSVFKS